MGVLACVWCATASPAAADDAAASGAKDLDAEIAVLSGAVLADPLDSASAARLEELRPQRKADRGRNLGRLAQGLDHYLNGRFGLATQALERVLASGFAVRLADGQLGSPLADLVEESRGKIGPQACPVCGDTGWSDCRSPGCAGTGLKVCPDCKGAGHRESAAVLRGPRRGRPGGPCGTCRATGSVACAACVGRGLIACPQCVGSGRRELDPGLSREAADAIRRLIDLAGYLRDGGIDLHSPDALNRPPALTRGPSPP